METLDVLADLLKDQALGIILGVAFCAVFVGLVLIGAIVAAMLEERKKQLGR